MKLINKILKRNEHYITSNYGWRVCPFHGKEFHYGVDYGTHNKKIPLYGVEDGYVQLTSHSNKGYGNSVWVRYPRINISIFYAHLDRICVKKKQKVNSNTIIGYSGKTGNATGIHLHLGMTLIGSNTWLNPHEYDYKEMNNSNEKIHKVKKGETLWNIAKKYYGDGRRYTIIANKNNIKKPYVIYSGQKLLIP